MPRKCTICSHTSHNEIDTSLLSSDSFRTIADRFGIAETSLKRHASNHLPAILTKAEEAKEVTRADSLLEELKRLKARTYSIMDSAEKAENLGIALTAVREIRNSIELLLKVAGELQDVNTTVIVNNPQWIEIRTTILTVLENHPDAHRAMVEALSDS
jgi:hypothetical protein